MRKLVVQQWVTVDNIAAEEDGGLSFVSGEPFSEYHQQSVQGKRDGVHRHGRHDDSRREYLRPGEGLLALRGRQGEYGEKLNNLSKFVASSKLDDAPWGDFPAATVTRDPATIRELKEQRGRDIWLWEA